ncbi:MAG: 2-C-methyl-D-erythritol 4-phosphate cytidylyltransferase, partial [Acidobacteria bacterium]|nr:2-C-methyl-D-erythritol 4-phosphate cytidylyltransferase [Acidobacteriota bacterium]
CGAAVVGRPVDHTIKSVGADRCVATTVARDALWMAQTPQVFRREIITQAYGRRDDVVGALTDDAQLVEAMGQVVMMVLGDAANIKITTPEDLRMCEALLAAGWPFEPESARP